jgi:hypothetical protein
VSVHDDVGTSVEEISPEEGRRLLVAAARGQLGMSGQEFVEAWEAGLFADPDTLPVQRVAMLLPFGR